MNTKHEFYEEKFEEGFLYYHTSPDGAWIILPPMTLVERITRLTAELAAKDEAIEAVKQELKMIVDAANRKTGSPYTMLDDVNKHAHIALAKLDVLK